MNRSGEQTVVGIGELLWDCFSDRRLPGGAPANVAYHAAQLGHRGVIYSRVGEDPAGRELCDYVRSRGLSTEFVQFDPGRPTGRVTVDTGDPASPEYTIHEGVAWDAIRFDGSVERLAREASAVAVGTLAQRSTISRETIRRFLAAAGAALIVFDVNLRQRWYHREWIEQTLGRSGIVKLNEDEVTLLAALLETDGAEPEPFARALIHRYGVELVCVTRAERGSLWVTPTETLDVPGKRVTLVDAVGAGDAFTAALISARLRGWSLERTADLANEIGGLVASCSGAMPDLERDLAELFSNPPQGKSG